MTRCFVLLAGLLTCVALVGAQTPAPAQTSPAQQPAAAPGQTAPAQTQPAQTQRAQTPPAQAAPDQPAPAPAAPAPPAAPKPPAAGQAVFRVFRAGRPIATETVLITVTDTEYILFTGTQSTPQGSGLRAAEFRYDRQWHPTASKIERAANNVTVELTTRFTNGKADTEILQNDVVTPRHTTVSADALVIPNNVWGAYCALAARLSGAQPGTTLPIFVLPEAEVTVRLDDVSTERISTPDRAFASTHYKLTINDFGSELKADLWTDEQGMLVRLVLPVLALDVAREDLASVSTRQTMLFRDNDEDVFIPALGFNLAGTVSKPLPPVKTPVAATSTGGAPAAAATAAKPDPKAPDPKAKDAKPAKLPAIVLIGASENDRDEMAYGIPIFAQLADALANAGYLVVRYDKRGVGQSGGRTESATLEDFADDAIAAVTYLRDKRKDVDDDRIAVLGYGEGAAVAMLAAKKEGKKIKALVLVGCGATLGQDLILEQQRHVLDRLQMSGADRQAKIDEQKKLINAALTGQGWDTIDPEVRRAVDTPQYRSVLQFDPANVLKDVRQPLLIVQGALDKQVPPSHADKLLALARARKKTADAQVALLPGVNHLLMPAKTGEMDEYGALESKTISADVAKKTLEWLTTAFAAKS